jgi:Kef-type K+ transport system membrane component KefB
VLATPVQVRRPVRSAAALFRSKWWAHRVRKRSKQRRWALDLRLSLLVMFTLSWLAQASGTSVLIAGFGTGLLVAALGGPERLFTQVRGLADGFFVPLFFVFLGARLQLGELIENPWAWTEETARETARATCGGRSSGPR